MIVLYASAHFINGMKHHPKKNVLNSVDVGKINQNSKGIEKNGIINGISQSQPVEKKEITKPLLVNPKESEKKPEKENLDKKEKSPEKQKPKILENDKISKAIEVSLKYEEKENKEIEQDKGSPALPMKHESKSPINKSPKHKNEIEDLQPVYNEIDTYSMKKLPLESEPCHCLIEKSMIMSSKVTMNEEISMTAITERTTVKNKKISI